MALSGSQITRNSVGGAGLAYAGFSAKIEAAAVAITQNLLFLDKENKEISLSEQNMTIILGKGKWVG